MNTTDVVTRICQTNPDLTRPDALSFVKDAVLLLTKDTRADALYYDPATGGFPYLATTAGTYQYSINTTAIPIWKVGFVLIDEASGGIPDGNNLWLSSYGYGSGNTAVMPQVTLLGKRYYSVPFKGTIEIGSTAPKVMFFDDPGTEDTRYRIAGYQAQNVLTSESVDIGFPEKLFHTALIPACLSLIDGTFNGRYAEQVAYIEQVLRPKVRFEMGKDDSAAADYTASPMGY